MVGSSGGRAGVTLIELLVVLIVVGLLAALLIPAVQSSREAARAATCRNNLRQVALAALNHESASKSLPDLYNGGFLPRPRSALDEFHFHSWRTAILPGLERSDVLASLNLDMPSSSFANQTGVNVALGMFICPSSANPTPNVPDVLPWQVTWSGGKIQGRVGTAARTDYEAVGGIQTHRPGTTSVNGQELQLMLDGVEFGAWGEPTYKDGVGPSLSYRKARLTDVVDGLSNTMLIGERAGRPDCYRKGKPVMPYPYTHPNAGCGDIHQSAWALSTHFFWLVALGEQPVNAANALGVFSFHPGGANVALCDGSSRFLRETTSQPVLKALATRAGGETVSGEW